MPEIDWGDDPADARDPRKRRGRRGIPAEDRAWVEAVDHYLKGARRSRRARSTGGQGRYVLGSALILALLVSPLAVGGR